MKKPPSRIRYEAEHPTVSCRVPKDIYDRLQTIKDAQGRSFADILKVGLGLLEVKLEKDLDLWQSGYNDAQSKYGVVYLCSVCGEPITVQTAAAKSEIAEYMKAQGWGHKECHKMK